VHANNTAASVDARSDEVAAVRRNREIEQSVVSCITYEVSFCLSTYKGGMVWPASGNREGKRGEERWVGSP
jgi:hypothetical protein